MRQTKSLKEYSGSINLCFLAKIDTLLILGVHVPTKHCIVVSLFPFFFSFRSTYLYILFIRAILVTSPVTTNHILKSTVSRPRLKHHHLQIEVTPSSISCNYTTTFIISFTYFSNVSCFACIVSSFLFEL